MKIFRKSVSLFPAILTLICSLSVTSFAANYQTNYSSYTAGTVYYTSPVIKNTSAVDYFQRAINYCIVYKGLNTDKLDCDSSFGPACKNACKAFQSWANKKYGYSLAVDGSFGPASQKAMKEIIAEAPQSEKKILNINWNLIEKTGKQTPKRCFCYSLAYARDILDGEAHNATEYLASGCNYAADRAKAGFGAKFEKNKVAAFKDIYNKLKAGQPVILNVSSGRSTGEHYVCAVGYENVTNTSNLSEKNFLIIDPVVGAKKANGKYTPENLGSVGYILKNNPGQGYYYCFKK